MPVLGLPPVNSLNIHSSEGAPTTVTLCKFLCLRAQVSAVFILPLCTEVVAWRRHREFNSYPILFLVCTRFWKGKDCFVLCRNLDLDRPVAPSYSFETMTGLIVENTFYELHVSGFPSWSCGTGVRSTSLYPRFIKVRPAPPDCQFVADDVHSESEPR